MKLSTLKTSRIFFLFMTLALLVGSEPSFAAATVSSTPIEPFEIGIYPNPANSYLSINYHGHELREGNEVLTFTVINLVGKRFTTVRKDCSLDCEFSINTSQYPPGVYFLLVEWKGQRSTRKFTILH